MTDVSTQILSRLDHMQGSLDDMQGNIDNMQGSINALTQDMQTVRYSLGSQNMIFGGLNSDIQSLKHSMRAQTKEVRKLGVLYEDLDERFATVVEAR